MSNYVKAVDYSAKDALATGNPNKIIKGAELNDEFNAIATAIGTKADLASPTFLGNPSATTQPLGNNSARLATTAFVQSELNDLQANVAITGGTIEGVAITGGSISGLDTPLEVASGGTGSNTLPTNNVLLGNGTSAIQGVAPGSSGNVLTSNGTTWVSSLPAGAIGAGQTWQTVSRALNTLYTNNTSKPIQVSATINLPVGAGYVVQVGGVNVASDTSLANTSGTFCIIIPVGASYQVVASGSANIDVWAELR